MAPSFQRKEPPHFPGRFRTVDTAPTQSHAPARQHADAEYGSGNKFGRMVKSLPEFRWRGWDFRCKQSFAVHDNRASTLGNQIFCVQITSAKQAHDRKPMEQFEKPVLNAPHVD